MVHSSTFQTKLWEPTLIYKESSLVCIHNEVYEDQQILKVAAYISPLPNPQLERHY